MSGSDTHVHTHRCGHAGGDSRDYVLQAIERGLDVITFTDHIPLYFLPGDDPLPDFAMAKPELPDYVAEVQTLAEEFSGRIEVRLGIEADYVEGRESELVGILSGVSWDVVLGSVHWVAGDWIDAPGSGRRHDTEGSEGLWNEYYRLLAKACLSGFFDVMTHFDLPKKFGHRMPAACRDSEDDAIAAAARSGVAVEVSSAGLRKPIGEEYPGPPLLGRLVAAGVPIVLSSDAHAPAEVGWGRALIETAAREAGARESLTFEKRRAVRYPL